MSRLLRVFDESGFLHVVLRGNDQQIIFFDDMDRRKMRKELKKYCDELAIDLIAYCMMDNHIHIILHDSNYQFSTYMKKLEIAYVRYFNAKYNRCGHLFQDRFYSKPIINDAQLLCAVRYVHLNPEEAGICSCNNYLWSSYDEYINGRKYCNTTIVLQILDGTMKAHGLTIRQISRITGISKGVVQRS